jgi:sensor histidine kinase regulating citrate/malate metabolism
MELRSTIIKLKESKEIISYLRAYKHDFFNHLQVIRGLAQIGKGERIISYVDSIVEEVGNVFDITNIAIPEIAVVIMQKTGEASKKNIETEVILNTNLADLKGNHMDFSQILFNLLDNSIAALTRADAKEKKLRITLEEDGSNYFFMIHNNGPTIFPELQDKIYDKGFSTKNKDEGGMGLYIVKNIVEKYDGEIKLTSSEGEGTRFIVTIPK